MKLAAPPVGVALEPAADTELDADPAAAEALVEAAEAAAPEDEALAEAADVFEDEADDFAEEPLEAEVEGHDGVWGRVTLAL